MKKAFILILAILTASVSEGQNLLYETFNKGIPSTWTQFNDNNVAHSNTFADAWSVSGRYGNPAPAAVSTSWFQSPAEADRWLITPAIAISDTGFVFSLEAACFEAAYPDGFEIRVSTTNDSTRQDFDPTPILRINACAENFTEYSVSLNEYVGDTIYLAIVQNSSDMNFLMVDDVRIGKPWQPEIELTQIILPSTVMPDSAILVGSKITNKSSSQLRGINVSIRIKGTSYVSENGFEDIVIPGNGSIELSESLPFILPVGVYQLDYVVSPMNNSPYNYLDNDTLSAVLVVADTTAEQYGYSRTALVEEFAYSDDVASAMLTDYFRGAIRGMERCIWMTHHLDDTLSNAASTSLLARYGTPSGPSYMVDRTPSVTGVLFQNASSVQSLLSSVSVAQAVSSPMQLAVYELQFDQPTRQVTCQIKGSFKVPDISLYHPHLEVYLVEDSVLSTQASYFGAIPDYRNAFVVRQLILDQDLEISAGNDSFYVNVSSYLPTYCRAWRCKLVAVVTSDDDNGNPVLNSAASNNFEADYVGINEVGTQVILNLYPNPTSQNIHVESTVPLQDFEVVNILGQTCYRQKEMIGGSITLNVSQYPSGIYFLRVKTDRGFVVKRFTVSR